MQHNVEKFKPKGALKNIGGCVRGQVEEESRYRLSCKPTSLWERVREGDGWEEPSWGENKHQTLSLGTVPSKEPKFDWISL